MFGPQTEPAKSLYRALTDEMANRRECSGLEWIENERNSILKAATSISNNSKQYRIPTLEEVVRAENNACGHSDYAAKFAYGVANAMMGLL